MWCFFKGGHKWEIIRIWNYRDTSYCDKDCASMPCNLITWKCSRCNAIKKKDYYGGGFLYMDGIKTTGVPKED